MKYSVAIIQMAKHTVRSVLIGTTLLLAACNSATNPANVSDAPDTPFKLATFEAGGRVRLGLVLGERVLDIAEANAQLAARAGLPVVAVPAEVRALIEQYDAVQAHAYVFGYSVLYDLSDRGGRPREVAMFAGPNWFDGKSIDRGAPFGPVIVPKEFVKDPENLRVVTKINGEVMQDGNTSQFIWKERHLISYATSILTLYPGDVISTGTPAGTGAERQRFLKPGDVVTIEVEGIGTLTTPMKAWSERPSPTP